MWHSMRRVCFAIATVSTVALLGVLVLAASDRNQLVTPKNFEKLGWNGKTREEVDAVLGPPACVQHDVEASGITELNYPGGGCTFKPTLIGPYLEVRTYIGKPDKRFNRFTITVCYSQKSPGAKADC